MATYLIKSVYSDRLVASPGNEVAGDPVSTYFGSTALTFAKALDGAETLTTIKGDAGLYIAPGPTDNYLIWSEAGFIWNVVLTDSAESHYELIPANGEDRYWAQVGGTEYEVSYFPGSKITGDEAIWKITAEDSARSRNRRAL